MNTTRYDIFSGTTKKDARWLEAVEGLGAAKDRMMELGKTKPGPYFIFDPSSRAILAQIDTTTQVDAR